MYRIFIIQTYIYLPLFVSASKPFVLLATCSEILPRIFNGSFWLGSSASTRCTIAGICSAFLTPAEENEWASCRTSLRTRCINRIIYSRSGGKHRIWPLVRFISSSGDRVKHSDGRHIYFDKHIFPVNRNSSSFEIPRMRRAKHFLS